MPLIIEKYDFPFEKISQKFFPGVKFTHLKNVFSEEDNELYCYIREEQAVKKFAYYFSKIFYYEKGKVVFIDKVAQRVRYYDADTMKLVKLTEETKVQEKDIIDKKEFLPHLYAQGGDLVLFPEEDSDE